MTNRLLYLTYIFCCFSLINEKTYAEINETISIQVDEKSSNAFWDTLYQSINNGRNWPALHWALWYNHSEVADWLLTHSPETVFVKTPDVRAHDYEDPDNSRSYYYYVEMEDGYGALELALMKKEFTLAKKILNLISPDEMNTQRKEFDGHFVKLGNEWIKHMKVNYHYVCNQRITTPLHWAIQASDLEPLKILLENNVDLKDTYLVSICKVTSGYTYPIAKTINVDALEAAAAWGNDEALKMIILHTLKTTNPLLAETLSTDDLSDEIIQMFRVYGANPDQGTLLFNALKADDMEAFKTLLLYGANPEKSLTQTGESLFSAALKHTNSQFIDFLIAELPAHKHVKDAIAHNRLDVLNQLLALGLGDFTDLHSAISTNKNEAAAILIDAGMIDSKAVNLVVEKDNLGLFSRLSEMEYPMPDALANIINHNARKIADFYIERNGFTNNELYVCIEKGRLEILTLCAKYFPFSDELRQDLILKAIEYKQKAIFEFLLTLQ